MNLNFTKMEGCGNDYIYINCFKETVKEPERLSIKLSDRHFGIGGDGIILISPSEKADGKMSIFNMDGSEAKMCGNGIRCVGKYMYDNGIVKKEEITIDTLSGIKTLKLKLKDGKVNFVTVDMGKAELRPAYIPVNLPGESIINKETDIAGNKVKITCVSMGNPHCIVFHDDLENLEIEKIGPLFEKNSIFPEGVNTEFIKITGENSLTMRVWERGSGETLACGTGACATVVAATECGYFKKGEDIKVKLLGGELVINYTDERVLMTGPAKKVFDGTVEI